MSTFRANPAHNLGRAPPYTSLAVQGYERAQRAPLSPSRRSMWTGPLAQGAAAAVSAPSVLLVRPRDAAEAASIAAAVAMCAARDAAVSIHGCIMETDREVALDVIDKMQSTLKQLRKMDTGTSLIYKGMLFEDNPADGSEMGRVRSRFSVRIPSALPPSGVCTLCLRSHAHRLFHSHPRLSLSLSPSLSLSLTLSLSLSLLPALQYYASKVTHPMSWAIVESRLQSSRAAIVEGRVPLNGGIYGVFCGTEIERIYGDGMKTPVQVRWRSETDKHDNIWCRILLTLII